MSEKIDPNSLPFIGGVAFLWQQYEGFIEVEFSIYHGLWKSEGMF